MIKGLAVSNPATEMLCLPTLSFESLPTQSSQSDKRAIRLHVIRIEFVFHIKPHKNRLFCKIIYFFYCFGVLNLVFLLLLLLLNRSLQHEITCYLQWILKLTLVDLHSEEHHWGLIVVNALCVKAYYAILRVYCKEAHAGLLDHQELVCFQCPSLVIRLDSRRINTVFQLAKGCAQVTYKRW